MTQDLKVAEAKDAVVEIAWALVKNYWDRDLNRVNLGYAVERLEKAGFQPEE